MHFLVDVLYGIAMAAVASVTTWWTCRVRGAKLDEASRAESHHAAAVLSRLHGLATQVAVDVQKHSSQVEEIHDELNRSKDRQPAMIVDVVTKLIEANQQMQARLTSTEDRLRQQAEELQTHATEARTDALTLLANRRAFDDELLRRTAEFRRQRRRFSMIMVDVDHFKRFNDTHGHQAGDEVLRGVARTLRRKMREIDLVARYGGEEFAVILPGTPLSDACKAAVRACRGIEESQFRHDGKELRVTISLGVAEALDNEEGAALVMRADKALYAAKSGGRNRAYFHDGKAVQPVVEASHSPAAGAADLAEKFVMPQGERDRQSPAGADAKAAGSKPLFPRPTELLAFPNLPSRTTFCQQVRNRAAEWQRGGPTFSVMLLEVDQHEDRNDNSGRQQRDAAALTAAAFLAQTIRAMDVLGNYAPGCFALMLPTAGLGDAIQVAERLRKEFAEHSETARDARAWLTLSLGVVQVADKDDFISLLRRAETALDTATRNGGNRVYFHDGQRCAPITAMLEVMGYLA